MRNPFIIPDSLKRYGHECGPFSSADRLDAIKQYDPDRLQSVIDWPETQKTVRIAAIRRLKKLQKGAT